MSKFRRGSAKQYSIDIAMQLLKQRKMRMKLGLKRITYQQIADRVGVFSRNTISRWDHKSMSRVEIIRRQRKKWERRRKFTDKDEKIFAGWVVCRDLTNESSTTQKFSSFIFEYFNLKISPSYITNFMYRHHLSLKLVGNCHVSEAQESIIKEGEKFLLEFQRMVQMYNITTDKIIALDKTYLMTSPWHKKIRHLSPTGTNKPRKVTPSRGAAHEIWTTLRADGVKGPFFVQSKDQSLLNIFEDQDPHEAYISIIPSDSLENKTKKQYSRPAEKGMVLYLYYMIRIVKFFTPGTLIVSDGEKCFQTPLVQQILANHKIYFIVIKPSVLHQLMNPCDNNFHSCFKLGYYRKISNYEEGSISLKEKFHLAKKSYEEISETSVARMFIHCGLTGSNVHPREKILNLMFEGIRALNKKNSYHQKCLISYLKWCKLNNLVHLCSSLNPLILDLLGIKLV